MKRNHSPKRILSVLMMLILMLLNVTDGSPQKAEAAVASKELSANYLNTVEKYLHMDKKDKSTYDFDIKKKTGLEGASFYWYIKTDKGDPKAVVINKATGLVTAKQAGTAYIRCRITLGDGTVIRPEAKVNVINNITEVDLKDSIKNKVFKVGKAIKFDGVVLNTNAGKGKTTRGMIRFELKEDTTGADTVTEAGSVYPYKAGSFAIRAVCFENKADYALWVSNKKFYSDKLTAASKWYKIKVVKSSEAVVSTQEQLEKVLAMADYKDLMIETKEAVVFHIPEGNYQDVTLKVNAPKADVENKGSFQSITIQAIKDTTWIEYADGNIVYLSDDVASFIIEEGAQVKQIVIDTPNSTIHFEIHGNVEQIRMEQPTSVTLTGESKNIPITVEKTAEGSTITSSVPLDLSAKAGIEIKLSEGAEASTLDKSESNIEVKVDNQTLKPVSITTNNSEAVTVKAGEKNYIPKVSPTAEPSISPTVTPTGKPTVTPTSTPVTTTPIIYYPPSGGSSPTPSPSPSPTPSPTPSPSPSLSPSPSPSPTVSPSPSPSPIPSPDKKAPVITLKGDTQYFITVGEPFIYPEMYAWDDMDGDISNKIIQGGDTIDTNKAGDYTITYNVTDSAGNSAKEVNVSVHVGDWEAPVMTLNGNPIMFQEPGDDFNDPGVTAIDDVDGDLTDKVVVYGADFNRDYIGAQYIDYEVKDAAGNQSNLRRIVFVSETNSTDGPVILMLGWDSQFIYARSKDTVLGAVAMDYVDGDITSDIVISGDTVDVTKPGEYTVNYDVKDSNGTAATRQSRLVVVFDPESPTDTAPPKIFLYGDETIRMYAGEKFEDPGAFAYDLVDGYLGDRIVTKGIVDTGKPGSYKITYTVTDHAGLSSSVSRTVIVKENDYNAPVVTLKGDRFIYLTQGDSYSEPGVTAVDDIDGDITDKLDIWGGTDGEGNIDTSIIGSSMIYYQAWDDAGNSSRLTRMVTISKDGESPAPGILLQGWEVIYIPMGDIYTDAGAIASDKEDGDITDQVVTSGEVDTSKQGYYEIRYNVTDNDGNMAEEVIRRIDVYDKENQVNHIPPDLFLHWGNEIFIAAGEPFTDPGAEAWDDWDGELTDDIVVEGNVDTSKAGIYELKYKVCDSAGNYAQSTRIVHVEDWYAPVMTLSGSAIIFLNKGDAYIDPGVTAFDNVDGDVTNQVSVNGTDFNTQDAGVHYIDYEVKDAAGNKSFLNRMVAVSDTLLTDGPLIYMYGYDKEIIDKGIGYVVPGAIAMDYKDGDITNRMLITGNVVDTSQVGEYTITYSVTDSDGITEAESRLIVVFDPDRPSNTTPPKILLNGDADRYIYKDEGYDEWGAFAYDLEDGYLGDRIAISGTVDITTSGDYEVTYTVTDNAGLSTSVIRTVHVMGERDHIPPSLVLIGDPFIFRIVGDSYADPGYTAIDNIDGDITPQVVTNGNPDMTKPGFCFIQYKVCDSSGNFTYENRHVVVRGAGEPAYPLLSINRPFVTVLPIGGEYTVPTVVAYDPTDRNVTSLIQTSGDTVDTNKEGIYRIYYQVTNSLGLTSMLKYKVVVTNPDHPIDYTEPVITLIGGSYCELLVGETFTDPGAVAVDDREGDISTQVQISGSVDTSIPGMYKIMYTVSDSSGNQASVTRTVIVK